MLAFPALTDVGDLDLFVALAGGRSALRVVDLLALAELVGEMRAVDDAGVVSEILPRLLTLVGRRLLPRC